MKGNEGNGENTIKSSLGLTKLSKLCISKQGLPQSPVDTHIHTYTKIISQCYKQNSRMAEGYRIAVAAFLSNHFAAFLAPSPATPYLMVNWGGLLQKTLCPGLH